MRQDGGARIRRTGGRRDKRVSIHKGSIRGVGSNILNETGTSKIMKSNTSHGGILVAKPRIRALSESGIVSQIACVSGERLFQRGKGIREPGARC
jgi:hypothetical protein